MTGTLIEPWTSDAVTFYDRLEATLQTIRKFAVVHVDPAPTGGYLVKVEVYKELEDMTKPASQPAGRAAFYNDFPVNRTRDVVGTDPHAVGVDLDGAGHEPGAERSSRGSTMRSCSEPASRDRCRIPAMPHATDRVQGRASGAASRARSPWTRPSSHRRCPWSAIARISVSVERPVRPIGGDADPLDRGVQQRPRWAGDAIHIDSMPGNPPMAEF